jgi:hypothetical protein
MQKATHEILHDSHNGCLGKGLLVEELDHIGRGHERQETAFTQSANCSLEVLDMGFRLTASQLTSEDFYRMKGPAQ